MRQAVRGTVNVAQVGSSQAKSLFSLIYHVLARVFNPGQSRDTNIINDLHAYIDI